MYYFRKPIVGRATCRALSLLAAIVMIALCAICARAQESTNDSTPSVSLSGSLLLTSDFYEHSGDTTVAGRRPAALHRILFTPTIKLGGVVSLPFNLMFTWPETNTLTAALPTPTLAQILENPANALGIANLNPSVGWAALQLGSFTPTLSPLTTGDQQLFGAGVTLTPGAMEISAASGVQQRAVEPDTGRHIPGAYRRDFYATRLAYGKRDSSHIGINLAYAKDAVGSLANNVLSITPAHNSTTTDSTLVPADTVRLQAVEGTVVSTDVGILVADGILFKAELAGSLFTRDLTAPEQSLSFNPFGSATTTRTSTRFDAAGTASLRLKRAAWGLSLTSRYIGPGFVPIGYPFMQSDRLEFTVSPELHIDRGRWNLSGSFGERLNNLAQTKSETTTQIIGSAACSAQLSEALSLSASYSNFGLRNDLSSDTLKVQNVSQSVSLDPSLILHGWSAMHVWTASAGLDKFDDYNTLTRAQSKNDTRRGLIGYSVSMDSLPLTLGVTGSYLENALAAGTLIVRTFGGNVGYSLFNRAVTPALSITTGSSTDASGYTDRQLFVRFGMRCRIAQALSLSANATVNQYRYGNTAVHSAFNEQLLQLALTTQF